MHFPRARESKELRNGPKALRCWQKSTTGAEVLAPVAHILVIRILPALAVVQSSASRLACYDFQCQTNGYNGSTRLLPLNHPATLCLSR